MKWLCAQRLQPVALPEKTLCCAALSGNIDMVDLVNQSDNVTQNGALPVAMQVAADKGYVHMCKYLHELGYAWDTTSV
jgi:hypothetical protein